MRFTDDFIDEIKARLRPSEVIGRRVKLRRQGREFAGLSPFNKEKTPSFFVNDEKGFYHCFSSGKHGDIFSFLQETEGMSFPEAVEALAVVEREKSAGNELFVKGEHQAAVEQYTKALELANANIKADGSEAQSSRGGGEAQSSRGGEEAGDGCREQHAHH